MYLLDTNVLSELRKEGKIHPGVESWADKTSGSAIFLSAITIMEVEIGTLSLARRDKDQALVLRNWIDYRILPSFRGRILPVDIAVAQRAASLHVPNKRPDRDALIAATALVHRLIVVTRNVVDFEPTGVQTVNPWD